jgi:hypothetical protein
MDKKSKILFTVIFLALIASVALTYYRTIVVQDYYVIETAEE